MLKTYFMILALLITTYASAPAATTFTTSSTQMLAEDFSGAGKGG